MFEFKGCNLIDSQCECKAQKACTNPFSYKNKKECAIDLHEGNYIRRVPFDQSGLSPVSCCMLNILCPLLTYALK